MSDLTLCFAKSIGVDIDGNNVYELLFTEESDTFWGEGFEYMPTSLVTKLLPNEGSFSLRKTIKTNLKLCLATESCCHSMQDCIDGIIALAYEDISNYEEFPENGRLVLHYGDSYDKVERELAVRDIWLTDESNEGELD